MKFNINYKKASLIWGGVEIGYVITKEEIKQCSDNADTTISVVPYSNGHYYEISDITRHHTKNHYNDGTCYYNGVLPCNGCDNCN